MTTNLTKHISTAIAGFIIGYLAMVGLNIILAEWLYISAIQERERIRSVIIEMLKEERAKQ